MKTKRNLKSMVLLAAVAVGMTLSSCNKDTDTIPDPIDPTTNTITDIVVAGDDFSILESAVVKADLQGTLSGTGPFTVFAPDNDAFAAAGISASTIASLSASDLESLLLYHTLNGKIEAADVPAGPNAKVVTANGDSVFVTRNTSGVFVNGIQVKTADVSADNGVVHVLTKALTPASGNIVETAVASGLDSLVKAVTTATNAMGGDPTLANTLSTATLTVFAPTNAAFTQLLTDLSVTDINDIPIQTLLDVLQYHVVPGRAFSSDLANGPLGMLAGGNTTIDLSGNPPTITGTNNGTNSSAITATNIMCTNGVVHLIDRVLLP
jgi:uncharacterized surface protein with fasciclin (FAS1) repeats